MLTAGDWSLKVGDGKHNHDMTDVLKGHKTVGRLNPNEPVHLEEMVDSNVPPRQMLTNLKKMNCTTSTTIKHIYNASYRYRRSIRGRRNDMQHLLKSLVDNGYVYHCRKYHDSDDVSDVFWAHPNSTKLFNTFSTVLVLDSTYKTNKYRLSLLVRAKCRLDCKVKDLKGKNGKAIKPASVVKTVMVVWLDIVDSETEEAYIDNWTQFKVVCAKYPKF